jgi:membrane protease subunit (stomatin/prohibitin family)
MGFFSSLGDSIGGTLADQWKDVIEPVRFNEQAALVPGIRKNTQNGRGNNHGADDILSNGTIVQVPEGTCAVILSQAGIEQVIETPGGYEYRDGQASILDAQDRSETGFFTILGEQIGQRFEYSGMSPDSKRVLYVNLRELRGIRYGTHGPLVYNDLHYGTDLEVLVHGSFSLQVVDPVLFVRDFIPANATCCNFENIETRKQLVAEFLQSLIVAINGLSKTYRIAELPSHANGIALAIKEEDQNAGTWESRFGIRLTGVAIEDIEFSEASRELVQNFAKRKMEMNAYENVSQAAANIAAQQEIAKGIRENGLGDAGGMLFGMNLASGINPGNAGIFNQGPTTGETQRPESQTQVASANSLSFDEQIETLKKWKELLDAGVITQEEYEIKKKQVMGL